MKRTLASLTTAGLLTAALLTATASAGTASSQLPLENEPIVWGGDTV
jgi:hypothetical protein